MLERAKQYRAPRLVRLASRLLTGSLLAFAALIAASNLLLWRSFAKLATGDLTLSYEPVWSFTPGKLRLRSVEVRRADSWIWTAEMVEGQLAWTSLVGGEARLRWARASGARWKLRDAARFELQARPLRLDEPAMTLALASAADSLAPRAWSIDELNVSFDSIEDGPRRLFLKQGLRLSSENIIGSNDGLSAGPTELTLQNSRLEQKGRPIAALSGRIRAERARAWLRGGFEVTTSLDWQLEVRARGLGSPTVLVRGPLRLERGRPVPPTHLTLALTEALAWAKPSFVAELGVSSKLEIVAAPDGRVTGTAHLPRLAVRFPGDWSLSMRSLVVERIWLRNLVRLRPGPFGLRLRAEHARLESDTWQGSIESPVEARLTVWPDRQGHWELGESSVELPVVSWPNEAAGAQPSKARLALEKASLDASGRVGLSGHLRVDGPSARFFLSGLSTPPPTRLLLAPFIDQPFEARAEVSRAGGELSLRALRVHAGRLQILGDVKRGASSSGALLFKTPMASLGVTFDGRQTSTAFSPPPDWLERQRARRR